MIEENRTLLIVDDEPETLKGYQQFLVPTKKIPKPRRSSRLTQETQETGEFEESTNTENYRLILASTGEEAVSLVKKEWDLGRRVAAGFFDVKLGAGMDGIQTIQAIRQIDPKIYCVVVTAYHDRSVDEINKIFGNDFKDQWDYLNKPFTQGEITQKARQMIAAWNRKNQLDILTDQLVRSERLAAVGQIARGVGHEFGNILLRILGKADLAQNETDLQKIKTHLEVILRAAERAGVIVRNLQSFSKTEPELRVLSPKEAIEQCLSLISHELIKSTVKLEKEFKTEKKCKMNVGAVSQILLNLMINAIHAMPQGGILKVTLRDGVDIKTQKETLCCEVEDTGTGIADEVLPRIFDFAFSTKGDRGTGLGLAISKELAQAQGGWIEVETKVGRGSLFRLVLPAVKGQPKEMENA